MEFQMKPENDIDQPAENDPPPPPPPPPPRQDGTDYFEKERDPNGEKREG